ncbi:3-deoxy-manno-octulosonate cytidylyltransferase [compost metagenome]
MKSVAVLQARTNSSRLPGKVLLPIKGLPLVVLAAKRAANTGRKVIVATSNEPTDDALATLVEEFGLSCSRGSLENTLDRVVGALSEFDDDTLVFRLTADNVFPDGQLLDEVGQDFISRGVEYLCCNGPQSGLPYGVSAEVTWLRNLREASAISVKSYDKEHVTPYVIRKFGVNFFEKYSAQRMGEYRCTVDCLDDYLDVVRVFDGIKDPIGVGFLELVSLLTKARYQPTGKGQVPRLVFGTAQLGLQYGVANRTGRPALPLCEELIKTSIVNGVTYLDTARAYGDSEEVIGTILRSGWEGRVKVITKLEPLFNCPANASVATVNAFVDASIYKSCSALMVKALDVLMLHRASHVDEWSGTIWRRLLELRELGVLKKLGVSVQSPEELMRVLQLPDVEFVQMPFNIMDWRWDAVIPAIQSAKRQRGLTVHVRSALLQGLLPSVEQGHWLRANVTDSASIIDWLNEKVIALGRLSVADLCLSYVNSLEWVDGIATGMENRYQLEENVRIFSQPPLSNRQILALDSSRPKLSNKTLDPKLWR